jgi:hypothetical protein
VVIEIGRVVSEVAKRLGWSTLRLIIYPPTGSRKHSFALVAGRRTGSASVSPQRDLT